MQSRADDVPAARRWLVQHAETEGLDDATAHELGLALTEMLTNVIDHSGEGRDDDKIDLTATFAPDRAVLRIHSPAPPFEPGRSPDPDDERGYGLLLLNVMLDEVDSVGDGSGGSITTLVKNL